MQLGNGIAQGRLFLTILWRRWHGLRDKTFRPGCACHATAFVQGVVERHLVAGFPFLLRQGTSSLSEMTAKGRGLARNRSEEHTSELQSRQHLVCRLLLEKKKKKKQKLRLLINNYTTHNERTPLIDLHRSPCI